VPSDRFQRRCANHLLRLAALGTVALCVAGCVQRRMTIRTNPPGALVYIDNYEIGTTPVSTDFIYYGRRQIRLEKPGFETLTIEQPIPAPWYQWFPLDFVSENLVPGEIRDERVLNYQLIPQRMIPPQEILNQAEQLRQNALAAAAPPPYAPPGGAAPYGAPAGAAPYGVVPPGIGPNSSAPLYTPGGATAPQGVYPGGIYPGGAVPGVQPAPPQPQPPLWMRMPPPTRGGSTFAPPPQPPAGR
jgi:PEGA domain